LAKIGEASDASVSMQRPDGMITARGFCNSPSKSPHSPQLIDQLAPI
jgi:hypothetical protein